jgi:hypothetical protein
MSLPGFTAEASAPYKNGHFRLLSNSQGTHDHVLLAQAFVSRAATGLRVGLGGQGLGFTCGGLGCICSGDADCNDMFSTNACGPNAGCFESAGQVICVCSR